jgi:hypothetical protein
VISKFFIERPILANVIALITITIGLVFLNRLPVAQYPQIVPPTIQVSARYPGGSAEVVAATLDDNPLVAGGLGDAVDSGRGRGRGAGADGRHPGASIRLGHAA